MYAKNDPLISYEDLEQEAWVGLLSAAKNYDSTKAKFTTYAYYYVRGRILRYVLEKTRLSPRRTEADPADVEQGYEDNTLEGNELMGSILGAVANEPHANFLVEHYIHGKSFRKIAKASGMSHQGVAMHVKRLIGLLEKRLNHENA
jgi:RNA polymerase sigma factor (sigma-70 family)